jgi:hypothetical protein
MKNNKSTLLLACILTAVCAIGLCRTSAFEPGPQQPKFDDWATLFAADQLAVSTNAGEAAKRKEVAWLGLSTDEASEALIAQLGLDSAIGLVVTYVAPEGPAAQAGLQKHDVLSEIDGQALAHPAQLRKLVQSRSPGQTVDLVYYRAGKKDSVSITLGKTTPVTGLPGEEHRWSGDLRELQRQLRDLPLGDTLREQMKNLRESLGRMRIDHEEVRKDIRRSLEQARKSIEELLRQTTNTHKSLGTTSRILEDLARGDIEFSKDATVIVKSSGAAVKTIVKTDKTGTYVIIADPLKRLTAHDKNGRLLFDGEIETEEQRAKVPADIWKRVEPMLQPSEPKQALPQLEAEELPKQEIM